MLLSVIAQQVLHTETPPGTATCWAPPAWAPSSGAVWLAAISETMRKGRVLLYSGLCFSLALIVFSFSRNFYLSLAVLMLVGGGLVVSSASINSTIQEIVPDHLRGRVVGMWAFIFAGFAPGRRAVRRHGSPTPPRRRCRCSPARWPVYSHCC